MNYQAIMKQAQDLKNKITKATAELEAMTFIGKSSLVTVETKGTGKIEKVNIKFDDTLDQDNLDVLADMFMIAANDSFAKLNAEKDKKLGAYTKGMPGLF